MMLRFISTVLLISSFFHDAGNAAKHQYENLLASPVFTLPETRPRIIRSIKRPFEFSAETPYNYDDAQFGIYAEPQTYIAHSNVNQEPSVESRQSDTQNYFGSNQIVSTTGSGNNVVQVISKSNKNSGVYLSSDNDGSVIYVNSDNGALHISNKDGVVQISSSNAGKKKNTMIYVNGVQVQA